MDIFGVLGFGFGMIGFMFGISALAKLQRLEKRIEALEDGKSHLH